jgi:hypothetical protein
MNPELLRNLWLEASPFRLALIAGLLLLVFAAGGVAPARLMTTQGAALALYWFFAVLWGTRSAALSVVAEIRERTWDSQKLSSIGPWTMVWGKLFGATAANWFGALVCVPFILAPVWRDDGAGAALLYAVILLSLGVFAQAVALLSSLILIHRQTGNWRLDTFLCQVAGIGAAFAYYSLWSSIRAFEENGTTTLFWWGHEFTLGSFHLVSLLLFLGWALTGCWRAMRSELRFANGPYVWLAYLAYVAIYSGGFESVIGAKLRDQFEVPAGSIPLALVGISLMALTYGMAFLEPKDPVRLRWLGDQLRGGRWYRAFLAADCWMLSYAATLIAGVALAALWVRTPPAALAVLAMLGFMTRDICIFLLGRMFAGPKGDFAALAILAALYLLLPTLLWQADAAFLLIPGPHANTLLSVVAAWAQGLGFCFWVVHAISDRAPRS